MNSWIASVCLIAALFGLAACNREEETETLPPQEEAPVPEAPASIMRPDIVRETVIVEDEAPKPLEAIISFAEGGSTLGEEDIEVLGEVLESEQLQQGWPLILRGHSDSVGDDETNLRISRRRAQAVADWLIEQGVEEERITVIALGEQRPIAPNANLDGTPFEKGRAMNRRVTITIAPPELEASEDEQADGENETPGEA